MKTVLHISADFPDSMVPAKTRAVAAADRPIVGLLAERRFVRQELHDSRVGIEADLNGVRPDEAAEEDAAGQLLELVLLDRVEKTHGDVGLLRNGMQGDLLLLARFAQSLAYRHAVCSPSLNTA